MEHHKAIPHMVPTGKPERKQMLPVTDPHGLLPVADPHAQGVAIEPYGALGLMSNVEPGGMLCNPDPSGLGIMIEPHGADRFPRAA